MIKRFTENTYKRATWETIERYNLNAVLYDLLPLVKEIYFEEFFGIYKIFFVFEDGVTIVDEISFPFLADMQNLNVIRDYYKNLIKRVQESYAKH